MAIIPNPYASLAPGAVLYPAGDTTGVKDFTAITAALAKGPVILAQGNFWTNQVIQIPGGAVLIGVGGPSNGGTNGTTISMASGANLAAVAASSGWTASTNTSSVLPAFIRGVNFNGNSGAQTGGAGHGLVLQTYYSYIEDCEFGGTLGDGLRFDQLGANGTTAIANTAVENRVTSCQTRFNGGRGINVNDPTFNTFTDGFITDCIVDAPSQDGIRVQAGAGWKIHGNHLYGTLNQSGIAVSRPYMTRITNNYIESWAQSGTSGSYGAIDLGYGTTTTSANDGGNGSVISGNAMHMLAAPGNAGSEVFGIGFFAANTGQGDIVITGNMIVNSGQTLPASAKAIALGTGNSSSVVDAQIASNLVTGTWTAGGIVKTGAGAFNLNTGSATLTAGSAVVANALVTATSRILLTSQADGGTPGWLRVSARTAGTSFTITSSSNTDTSTVAYEIFEPG